MRWPSAWKDPSALSLLKGTAIDYLLIGKGEDLAPVRSRAQQDGLHLADPEAAPTGITVVKGEWPGVKMSRGGGDQIDAGPTGVPWVDSNGWAVRLSTALHPETCIWVDAPPAENARIFPDAYVIAIADSAAYGGRWVLSLDNQLAAALAAQRPEALATWKRVTAAAGFFAGKKSWSAYAPLAVVGVVSDFSGKNEFFSQELLNLLARAGQHYRVLPKERVTDASFDSLRAVIYIDADPPPPVLRKQILAFVQAGGMLIAAPQWGEVPGAPSKTDENPRYSLRTLGKGWIAQAKADPDDPYLWANDSVLLVSHRYDLVRFWNGGATASFYTLAPDRKQALVHLLFYADRGPDSASVRIAGRYRSVKAATVEQASVPHVEMELQKDAVEVHLPQVSQYVALELDT
ncbi:MAG: hypothetical protein LAQ69_07475 [Acidobacteriia bacterium]|nr:hypothetical protein [Terriglobia bacterium]